MLNDLLNYLLDNYLKETGESILKSNFDTYLYENVNLIIDSNIKYNLNTNWYETLSEDNESGEN